MKNIKIIMCLLLSSSFFLHVPFVRSDSGSQALWMKSKFPIEKQNSLNFVPGEILVKYKEKINQSDISALNSYMRTQEIKRIEPLKVRRLKLPTDISVEDAVANYKMDPNVEYAEPNYIYHLTKMPNDSNFSSLWGLHNTGQKINGITGTMDADIDAPEAWGITTGSADVIIAVVDSGVAYFHPEIKPNIWINQKEFLGSEGFDDDNNGYLDDIYGWDFWANDNEPKDYNSHGTHVSGIIAGLGNNGTAITGVNWNARIMALRAVGITDILNTATVTEAIIYAVDNGAEIINASWGGTDYAQFLFDAISYANNHGVLFITAAGNGGMDGIGDNIDQASFYPSSYNLPNIISVAATDQDDNLTSYSNFGPFSVDVGAPGDNIYSTVPEISTGSRVVLFSEDFDPSPTGWTSGGINSSWNFVNGTGIGGSNCLEDSPGGNYFNNTDSFAGFSFPFFVTIDNIYKLSFGINADLEEDMDFMYLSYSLDGTDWIPDFDNYITKFTGGFVDYTFRLPSTVELIPSFYLGFKLITDSSNTRDGVYIDNLELYREPLIISGFGYDYSQGTSMATPYVSGVAGLVMAQNPNYNHLQVKDAIFNSVDRLPSLIDKVATEGRINAFKAVSYIAPPPNFNCTPQNGSVLLNWDANSESAVTGYIVSCYKNQSLIRRIDVGDVTTYEVSDLPNGTELYFEIHSVAEFPEIGLVKTTSSGVLAATPNVPASPSPSNPSAIGSTGGGGGGGCFISTSNK